ncbi:MAG: hypothetical protein OEV20_08575, partial [Actinomycetota bacterium]|nr:hypothetical protein [Actinomycetota bacterium]
MRRSQLGLVLMATLLLAAGAHADEEEENDSEITRSWSTTLIGDFKIITDPEADDDVGSFFDQYEFTPNKSSSVPFELGIRDLFYDEFGPGDTPRLQLGFESPTSNLGVSGSQAGQPFLNQRADLLGRYGAFGFDLRYWRFRTEELRDFPTTLGRPFTDLTNPADRFQRDRTGFFGEARLRLDDTNGEGTTTRAWLAPELSLRVGHDERRGRQQRFFLLDGTNSWGAFTQGLDQDATQVGGGVLVVPGGLLTLTLDADYERFRYNDPTVNESDLGVAFAPPSDSVGFIPDSDRITGTVRLKGRIADRLVLESGFHATRIEQVGTLTPLQIASDLDDNSLLFYSANVSADVEITERVSANAFLKYDQRNNDIDRDTPLFNPVDGSQVAEFLDSWNRIYTGAEAVYALHRRNLVAVGARFEWIDRELDFAVPNPPLPAILEPNALM